MGYKRIGVVGCGLMGSGIVQVSAGSGYPTVAREVSDKLLEKGMQAVQQGLGRLVKKETMTQQEADAVLGRVTTTTRLDDLADCDLIIEAVTEDFEVKKAIFNELEEVCDSKTVFSSNTSSLSITHLMTTCNREDRFVGLHFFNPVPVMKLVEVVSTIATDASVYEDVVAFAESLGKSPVRCQDRTGFLVNRLLVPYLLDAIRALEDGTGSLEDIDQAMRLGCGHPMGPFTLLDFVGLDTTLHIANIMFEEFREKRFAPPSLLKRMVMAGRLGRKSGRGFYDYQ